MAIPIQCPECHKKYQAPDHMAGKRVKCKHCGVVFLIAADARTADAGQDMSALDELNALAEPARRNPAKAAAGAGGEDIDSLFRCEYPADGAPRTNKLYVFPLSRLLDQWLPPVLLAVGLVWAVSEGFKRNDTGRPWVGGFRAAVFLLAFFASVFPFTLMGIRAAACKLNFELPPKPGLRIMGVYAVPFALACAMWLLLGGGSGLTIGVLIGCVVALPVLFLLFRLLPAEAPVAFGYATGYFVLSIVVATAGVFALNLMLVGALRATKSDQTLAVSPFGPNLKWDAPTAERTKVLVQDTQAGTADTNPSEDGADGEASTQPGTDGVATTGPTTSAVEGAVARADPIMPGPSVPTRRDVIEPANVNPNERPPKEGPGGAEIAAGGFVRAVRVAIPGAFRQIVQPTVPGTHLAVVREGRAGFDHVELRDARQWKKAAGIDVPRSPDGNRYALSPDGEFLCYLTEFPRLAVQVWSFTAGKLQRQIDLEAGEGEPRVMGFVAPDQLLVRRDRSNGETVLQVWSAKAPGRPRQAVVTPFDLDARRYAISPDGSTIAFILPGANRADLESWSLVNGRPVKQMPVAELDWNNNVSVAGLAFSPDGQRIAAVISGGQGAGVFVAWPAAGRGGRALAQHFLPIGVNPPRVGPGAGGPSAFDGRGFHWLDNGRAWLLFGGSVFDTETGALLGSVDQAGVRGQWADPAGNTCQLVHPDEFGGVHLFSHTLDLQGARRAAVPAAAAAQDDPKR